MQKLREEFLEGMKAIKLDFENEDELSRFIELFEDIFESDHDSLRIFNECIAKNSNYIEDHREDCYVFYSVNDNEMYYDRSDNLHLYHYLGEFKDFISNKDLKIVIKEILYGI